MKHRLAGSHDGLFVTERQRGASQGESMGIKSQGNKPIRGTGRTVAQNEGGHYTGTGAGHRGPGEARGVQGRTNSDRTQEKVTEHHRGAGNRARSRSSSDSGDE